MALLVDHQPNFKHFCKICKKGFMCGRALGGHMRAHGIGDENGKMDDEDPACDWEDKLGANVPPGTRRMYVLRTNPNRLKSCRVCENCGKEFLSWKSFLEHGKCTSEDADDQSLLSSPGSEEEDGTPRRGCGWSKRKRSLRAKGSNLNLSCPSSEEEDLANCLMMLSNATVDPLETEAEESCASASKEEEERRNPTTFMAPMEYKPPLDKAKGIAKGLFECKACKKVFNSHQALGGHRASHKKVKGCYASRLDQGMDDNSLADHDEYIVATHEEFLPTKLTPTLQFDHGSNPPLASTSKRKSKVHECSICHRVFLSGQALGGHKRCHWLTSSTPDSSSLPKFHRFQDHLDQTQQRPKFIINNSEQLDLTLDLNLPVHPEVANPSDIEVSAEVFLQPWTGVGAKVKDENNHQHQNGDGHHDDKGNDNNCYSTSVKKVDEEEDSKLKLAKLSELKDTRTSGSSSPWLQVGIGSTTGVGTEPL